MLKSLLIGITVAVMSALLALAGGGVGMALAETQRQGDTWEDDWRVGLSGMRGGLTGALIGLLVGAVLVRQRRPQS